MPIVRQVALDNVPLRNGQSSQKFSEEPMFIFFLQWELIIIIQIKWLILLLLDHGILYKPPKWPVLNDKCIRKSMVVCNPYVMTLINLNFNMWYFQLKNKKMYCIIHYPHIIPYDAFELMALYNLTWLKGQALHTGHDIPPRHSIQTWVWPVVLLSIDVERHT